MPQPQRAPRWYAARRHFQQNPVQLLKILIFLAILSILLAIPHLTAKPTSKQVDSPKFNNNPPGSTKIPTQKSFQLFQLLQTVNWPGGESVDLSELWLEDGRVPLIEYSSRRHYVKIMVPFYTEIHANHVLGPSDIAVFSVQISSAADDCLTYQQEITLNSRRLNLYKNKVHQSHVTGQNQLVLHQQGWIPYKTMAGKKKNDYASWDIECVSSSARRSFNKVMTFCVTREDGATAGFMLWYWQDRDRVKIVAFKPFPEFFDAERVYELTSKGS